MKQLRPAGPRLHFARTGHLIGKRDALAQGRPGLHCEGSMQGVGPAHFFERRSGPMLRQLLDHLGAVVRDERRFLRDCRDLLRELRQPPWHPGCASNAEIDDRPEVEARDLAGLRR